VIADDDRAPAEAPGGILDRGESLGQELVEGFTGLVPVAELDGFGLQLPVAERLIGSFELVDLNDNWPATVEEFAVMAAGKFL
jgi:hypothetical protein